MSSRICIKNVGTTTSERQLKELFGSRGEVTDVRIVRTKSGKSRQLAFVGFRTDVQAQDAIRYFNNTFIETSRVTVQEAKKVGDQELLENARSRHTKKKLEKLVKAQEKDKKDKKDKEKAASAPVPKAKAPLKAGGMSKEKRDFMEAMKPKKDKKFWGNDESGPAMDVEGGADADHQDAIHDGGGKGDDDSDADDDDDDDVNDLTAMSTTLPKLQKQQPTKPAAPEKVKGTMTDMDYLRSKVRAHFSDDEGDDSDDEHDEDAKSIERGNTDSKWKAGGDEEEENIEDEEKDESESGRKEAGGSSDDLTVVLGDDDDDSGRLFIRNLIFSCSEDELRALFEKYGPLSSVHLPLDTEKKGKGFGFVQFVIPEQAQRARAELDGSSFQGRLLHVIAAKKAPEVVPDEEKKSRIQGRMSAFQLKREDERRAQAGSKDGWNASFVRSDAVVDALAERYGVARNEILDRADGGGEMAVRLAIGEAQVSESHPPHSPLVRTTEPCHKPPFLRSHAPLSSHLSLSSVVFAQRKTLCELALYAYRIPSLLDLTRLHVTGHPREQRFLRRARGGPRRTRVLPLQGRQRQESLLPVRHHPAHQEPAARRGARRARGDVRSVRGGGLAAPPQEQERRPGGLHRALRGARSVQRPGVPQVPPRPAVPGVGAPWYHRQGEGQGRRQAEAQGRSQQQLEEGGRGGLQHTVREEPQVQHGRGRPAQAHRGPAGAGGRR